MRQQDVFKKIGNILQELNEQYEYLKTQGDSIDDLELELFAANANFLSDHLEVLRKLNATLTKSLPAHEPQAAAEPQAAPPSIEPHVVEEPTFSFNEPETIVEPPVAFVEEIPEPETSEPEPVIELPAEFANEISEEEAPTLEEYFHVETPETHIEEEAEPESAPEPGGGFHFDFETAEQPQEDADDYTSTQFQYQAEETEEENSEPTIDEETEEIAEAETEYKEEEAVTPAYHFEEPIAEQHKPSFEPVEQPLEIADRPAPEIDIKPHTGNDTFSFIRTTEPETIRHELTLDEAEAWASGDADEAGTINASYHKEEEPEQPTVAEAMAATVAPEPTPEPFTFFTPQPEPAPIPTYQLNQTPPAPTPEPAPATEPERPLTLNERLSAQAAANTNTPAASTAPIKDLKSAITLNDKMLFVRDLFNGYSLAYSEAIEILNRFNNFDDAERFLNTNYVEKNHWADKPATNEKFFDLLRRRFA